MKALKLVDDKRLVKSEPSTPAPDKDVTPLSSAPAPPTPQAPPSSRVSAPPILTSVYISGTDGKYMN